MRARALVLMTITVVALTAPRASANGGAYIEFEGTHHLPGEQVTGTVYVSIPAGKMDLLDRGPFYAYVLPSGTAIDPGRGLPTGAIRVGTFTIEQEKGQTELKVTFTVPQTEGDYYSFGLCNDPCTLNGFGEPVSGVLSVVATEREAALLGDVSTLHSQLAGLKRELRKREKGADEELASISDALDESEAMRQALTAQVSTLERQVAAADAATEEAAGRPLVHPWAAAAVAIGLIALAFVLAGRRRSRDTGGSDDVVPERA